MPTRATHGRRGGDPNAHGNEPPQRKGTGAPVRVGTPPRGNPAMAVASASSSNDVTTTEAVKYRTSITGGPHQAGKPQSLLHTSTTHHHTDPLAAHFHSSKASGGLPGRSAAGRGGRHPTSSTASPPPPTPTLLAPPSAPPSVSPPVALASATAATESIAPPHGGSNTVSRQVNAAAQRDPLMRPSVALSLHIMTIYKSINHKFYAQRDAAHHRGGDGSSAHTTGAAHSTAEPVQEITDDANGYYVPVVGELIANRYAVVAVLGKGSFGVVVQCVDEKYQESVAVKIIRSGPYFSAQGQLEADIVAYLNRNPLLENLVVQLRKAFVWKTHIVLVFEMLSIDLYQLIELTKFNGVSLDLTRKFAYQLLQVLLQLEQHEPPIIHCDLKPENVLLRDPSRSGIRVIDFGSSCYQQVASWSPLHGGSAQGSSTGSGMASEVTARRQGEDSAAQKAKTSPPPAEGQHAETAGESRDAGGGGPSTSQPTTRDKTFEYAIMPKYIQSRFYRSPEVILELGYTTAIDRWSLGCMLVELHTGIPLFPGRNEASMLALFTAVLGPLPDFMIAASPKAAQFFSTTSATTTTTTARAGSPASGDAPRSTAAPLKATESAPSKPSVPAAAPWADTPAVRAPEEPSSVLNMSQPEGDHSFPLSSWVGSTLSPISVAPPRAMDNSSTVMSSVQWEKDGTSGPPTSPYVLRHQTSPQASRTLSQVLGVESGGPRGCRKGQQGHDVESYALFFDFVHQLLEYDPRRRMSCAAAMSHPFLQPLREWEARATQARQQQQQQQQQLPPS